MKKCSKFLRVTFLSVFFIARSDELVDMNVEDIDSNKESTRLVVNTNISMVDSIDSSHGNIVKNGVRFINNFGTDNTFVGIRAGSNFNMTGDSNSAFGTNALRRTIAGRGNTAMGTNALTNNVAGTQNIAIGFRAMENTNGSFNTAVGYRALRGGPNFLPVSNSGQSNVAIGFQASESNQGGSFNVAIGRSALKNNLNGSNNIAIGNQVGLDLVGSNNDNIYIGNRGIENENGTIRLGNLATNRTYIAGIYDSTPNGDSRLVYVGEDGQLGIIDMSFRRFKSNIRTMADESNKIFDLEPVLFTYKSDETDTMQYGLIAEEVDAVFPALVSYDADGAAYTVRYEMLPVLLLNEMKKQNQDITVLKEIVAELQDKMKHFMAQ